MLVNRLQSYTQDRTLQLPSLYASMPKYTVFHPKDVRFFILINYCKNMADGFDARDASHKCNFYIRLIYSHSRPAIAANPMAHRLAPLY